ncbi:class IIb bacteriocin, lactobin A/cerein 7B family [Howardella ureilytica]|nr:class IIb bacteriocin, lactobin A/cerein 7B family [Lachnospiraceae bacterium]MDY2956157.1 class IIb bacteriocin, lactobin A/cerein 7B family [Lachnospiraceae bacterium]
MLRAMTNDEIMEVEGGIVPIVVGGSALAKIFAAGFAAGIAMGIKKWFK